MAANPYGKKNISCLHTVKLVLNGHQNFQQKSAVKGKWP